jgi:hypothetical protein
MKYRGSESEGIRIDYGWLDLDPGGQKGTTKREEISCVKVPDVLF